MLRAKKLLEGCFIFLETSKEKTSSTRIEERRLLLGLGPRHFFNHYPGHRIPPSVSITQRYTTTLSYPQFHSDRPLWVVFTVPLKWPMMMQIRVPRWPVVVNSSLNRHWSIAFVSIELEIPAITLRTSTLDPHDSLEWDFERSIRLQLVKSTVLKKKRKEKEKTIKMSATLIMLNNTKINASWRKVDRGWRLREWGWGHCCALKFISEKHLSTYGDRLWYL